MRYEVVKYGHPVLRQKSRPIDKITPEIKALAKDMLDAMYRYNGAGLAAQQVGRTECVCVIDVTMKETPSDKAASPENAGIPMPLVLINPRIVEMEGKQTGQEGCLSFPEIFVNVTRAAKVTATFMNLKSEQVTLTGTGLLARAIQHELDHLNGVLLVDRMSPVQKVANSGRLKRLKKSTEELLEQG